VFGVVAYVLFGPLEAFRLAATGLIDGAARRILIGRYTAAHPGGLVGGGVGLAGGPQVLGGFRSFPGATRYSPAPLSSMCWRRHRRRPWISVCSLCLSLPNSSAQS
jgi:hypothetical protein